MSDGFPLLTTKKMAWKQIVTELLWFLRGDTNIKFLVDNGCHIWDGDAYKRYWFNWKPMLEDCGEDLTPHTQEEFINRIKTDDEFAKKWGELGPVYGKQWRDWTANPNHTWGVDQIANLINDLKTNPDSRRLMVSAWNVGELDSMVLPPCHYGFQVYTRELSLTERYELTGIFGKEKLPGEPSYTEEQQHSLLDELVPKRAISLMYNARSQDVPLGTPFNISSYALLLEIIAKMVNMVPDELISNMGDCHVYLNQIDGIKEQLTREPFELPKLVISNQVYFNESIDEFLNSCLITDFQIEGYQSHPTIKFPLSN
jgi:thymidylate synthase